MWRCFEKKKRIEFTCYSADVYCGKGYASWKQEYGNMDDNQGAKAYRLTTASV